MSDATLIDAVKEYGRYKNGRKTSVGVFLNIIIVSTAVFMGLCFLFAKISGNNIFGTVIGAAVTFYIAVQTVSRTKAYILKKLPEKRQNYYDNIRLARLYGLSQEEFTELALRSVKLRNPDMIIEKNGIFYTMGDTWIVFLILAGKKEVSEEKINMALKTGAKRVTAVCTEQSREKITEKFGDKINDVITDADIIKDSPELDYEEEKRKKKINFEDICNNKNAARFIRLALTCLFISLISGLRAYFVGLAFIFGAFGVIMYAASYRSSNKK